MPDNGVMHPILKLQSIKKKVVKTVKTEQTV